jgi:hypothetical protein
MSVRFKTRTRQRILSPLPESAGLGSHNLEQVHLPIAGQRIA